MKRKLFQILNAIIRRGYWFNNIFFQDCRKFYTYKQFDTEVVNLGSTSAVSAFDYEGINLKCANWAISRNPLFGDYAILRNYSSFLKQNGATVIVTLCPFSSLAGSYEYLDDRYYTILYPTTLPGYSYIHNIQVNEKLNNPIMHYPWYALFVDVWKAIFKSSLKECSEEFLQRDADSKFNSWCHEFSIVDFKNPLILKNLDGIKDAQKIIKNICNFCYNHKCRIVIVIPPLYHTLSEKFTDEIRSILFGQTIISDDLRNVEIYDYLDSVDFMNDKSLFKDSFRLNKKGAIKFTRKVLSDLKLIKK